MSHLPPDQLPPNQSLRVAASQVSDPFAGVDLAHLEHSLIRPRTFIDATLTLVTTGITLLALVPLFSVLYMLVVRGWQRLSIETLTQTPPAPLEAGGGIGNAILGTLVMVGLAALVTIPAGVLTAVFLSQAEPEDRLADVVRFCAKVLTGFPSILAGVFAYGSVVLFMGGFSAIAGAVGLSILMLPTIILTSEDALRMVPSKMREAAIGMGATSTQTAWSVLLPTAIPGIATGVMLAIARAAGETAPLLFTALFSQYWIVSGGLIHFTQPTASLAVLIYNFAGVPFDNQLELAWTAALVLVLLVLVVNLLGQFIASRRVS